MEPRLAELVRLLELERLEDNLFRGHSRDIGSPQVFGGQVLGQALSAAGATVEEGRVVHSLHAYFLRRGDVNAPIVYDVDRSLDGHSFSNRRVVAIQHGRQIFNMAASFHIAESGFEHQSQMPQVPAPETLSGGAPPAQVLEKLPAPVKRFFESSQPFEFRAVQEINYTEPRAAPPERQIWFRAAGALPDDEMLHRRLLAYLSDCFLLETANLPHGGQFMRGDLVMASIDHAMWFHRPLRVDDWLLYAMDSPSASGARGFTRGSVFSRDGRLLASAGQEGLIRRR
ncbi:MAG: acyl-CoA thioesterase II [Proteobacteria bacterium]|nr:acyl-CoA thioesterase II [Pseudomonadota bacterium]